MHAWLGTWDASKRPTEVVACKRAFPGQQLSEEREYVSSPAARRRNHFNAGFDRSDHKLDARLIGKQTG